MTATEPLRCADCLRVLPEPSDTVERPPCPDCGSTKRLRKIFAADTLTISTREGMSRVTGRRRGRSKPVYEAKSGPDLYRDSGEWREIHQVVDHDNNRYMKRVIRPGGEVIRDVDEPLSDHQGYGAARRNQADG